jgi:hypothetical protein
MGDFAAGFASGAGQVLPGAIQDKERRAQQKEQFGQELALRNKALDQEAARNSAYIALLNAQAAAMTQGTAAGAFETDPAVIEAKRRAAIAAGQKAGAEGDTARDRLQAELDALRAQIAATQAGSDLAGKRFEFEKSQFDKTFAEQTKRWEAEQENIKTDRALRDKYAGWDYEFKLQESASRGVLANIQREAAERAKNELGPVGNAFIGYQLQQLQASGVEVQPDQFQQLVNAARQFDNPSGTGRPTGKISFGSSIPGIGATETAAVRELIGNMPLKDAIPAIASDPAQEMLFWGRTKKLLVPYGRTFVPIFVDAADYGDAKATYDKAVSDIPKEMRTPEQIQRAIYEYQQRYNIKRQVSPNRLEPLFRATGGM